jgi:hypothetical protein
MILSTIARGRVSGEWKTFVKAQDLAWEAQSARASIAGTAAGTPTTRIIYAGAAMARRLERPAARLQVSARILTADGEFGSLPAR